MASAEAGCGRFADEGAKSAQETGPRAERRAVLIGGRAQAARRSVSRMTTRAGVEEGEDYWRLFPLDEAVGKGRGGRGGAMAASAQVSALIWLCCMLQTPVRLDGGS